MKSVEFCISMILCGKEFHRPVTHIIMLACLNVPITETFKTKRFASLLPSTLLHPFTSVSGEGSLGVTGNFRIYTKAQNQEAFPFDCGAVSCQQWWWWWPMGLTGMGLEGTSGQHLRCNTQPGSWEEFPHKSHCQYCCLWNQDRTIACFCRAWNGSAAWALPCCQHSGSSLRELPWLLKEQGYKNCYSWGQILYFCRQAQTWWSSNKLQQWLIGPFFSNAVVS